MNNVIEELEKNYYSRWLTSEELLSNNNIKVSDNYNSINYCGLPIGSIDNKYLVDTTINHNLIIGSNGSGKSQAIVLPMLYMASKSDESIIVKDIKGELYKQTAGYFKNNGYEVITINLNNPAKGNSFNPLELATYLYKNNRKDEAITLISDFTGSMMCPEPGSDPYWANTSSSYATGLIISLIENNEEVSLNNLYKLTTVSDEELLDAYVSKIDKNSVIYKSIASTYLAPNETKSSILSVLNQKLSAFVNKEDYANLLLETDFDFMNIKDKKVAIYLIANQSEQNDSIVNTFISQACHLLENNKKCFNIILDQFDSSINPINNFASLLNDSRTNYIRFTIVTSGFLKLNKVYGRENVETIKLNCPNIFYLLSNESDTIKYISELCGKREDGNYLVSEEALKRISIWNAIYIKQRYMPYATRLIPFYMLPIEKAEELELTERVKKEVKLIDLEKYINE